MYKFQKISRPPPQREFHIGPPHLPGFSIFAGNWWPPTPSEFPCTSLRGGGLDIFWNHTMLPGNKKCDVTSHYVLYDIMADTMGYIQVYWVLRVCSSLGSMHGPHCAHYKIINSLHLARGINFTLGSAGKSYRYGSSGMINYTYSSLGYLAETIPTNNVKKNDERNQSELNT